GGVVPAVPVTFAVTGGGGSVSGSVAHSDANGVATVGSWTLGPGVGDNTLTATVAGSGISGNPVTFTATAVQPGAPANLFVSAGGVTGNPVTMSATGVGGAYQIDVRYLTAATAAQREAFDSAKAKWQRLIYGDVPDVAASFAAGTCGAGTPAINETIDDII